jgi:hypothetical protein
MFSNDKGNRLTKCAKPTLFNIPNPPAEVGEKRRLVDTFSKVSTIQSKGNYFRLHAK